MNKLLALFNLLRKGAVCADPAAWKNRQITATVLAAVLLAAANVAVAFGYPLPVDETTATAVATGLIALVNVVLTVATSAKVGLPAPAKPDAAPVNDRSRDSAVATPPAPPDYPQI